MLDCLPFLKIGRWREENVRDCIAFTAWEGSSSVLAAAIPALPVPHQWGLRLFPGIFLLAFYYSFWSSSPFSSPPQHLLFCRTCSHQWLMSAPRLRDNKPGVCSDTPCCLTVVLYNVVKNI